MQRSATFITDGVKKSRAAATYDNDLITQLSTDDLLRLLAWDKSVKKCKCGYIFLDVTDAIIHGYIHRSDNPLQCRECEFIFRDFYSFQAHLIHLSATGNND